MKKLLMLAFLAIAILPLRLFADPWDCMSRPDAEKLVAFLEANPFVVDYCDLCDGTDMDGDRIPAHLIRVSNLRIIACSWDVETVSVKADFEVLAWGYTKGKKVIDPVRTPAELTDAEKPAPPYLDSDDYVLLLNYHWTIQDGMVMRLGDAVSYEEQLDVESFQKFPEVNSVADKKQRKGYKKWLKRVGGL